MPTADREAVSMSRAATSASVLHCRTSCNQRVTPALAHRFAMSHQPASSSLLYDLLPAQAGAGRYLQRDYWAAIEHCTCSPSELIERIRTRFCEFAPSELAAFRRRKDSTAPLTQGDELDVDIAMVGKCAVRVVHVAPQSLTLATLRGHPEAGRITFGAYRNPCGDVIFHIRSRARSGSSAMYAGFLAAGEAMQTNTWTDFIASVALTYGSGAIGFIHAETHVIPLEAESEDVQCSPTFHATGDGDG